MVFSAGAGGADLGSARGSIEISTESAERALKQLQGSVGTFATTTESAFNRVATGLGLLAGARQLGRLFGGMVGQAADLESVMAAVAASLGGVGTEAGITEEQFTALNDEALRIGAETSKSATEAAAAMEMMAKAGVDVGTILDTGAQAAVNLSEATGEGLEQSAATMSSMLLLFKDFGLQGGRAADIITAGMNASNATMSEFQTGIARLAPTIKIAGTSFEEAAAAIAFFNSQGLSAAESGSSLNAAFLALANPTDDAAAALDRLGIAAFDAQGNFIGFPALFDQLAAGAATYSDKQQLAADITKAFGRDALDVMAIAAQSGSKDLRDLIAVMGETGTAADASKIRMNTFSGSVEQLRGAIETASIAVGRIFLPALRAVVDALTVVVNAFNRVPRSVQAVTGIAVVASAAIAGIAGAMVLAGPRTAEFAKSLRLIRTALLGTNPLLLAIAGGIALLGLAYKTNFGGFADVVNRAIDRLQEFGRVVRRSFNFSRSLPDIGNLGAAFAALGQAMTEVLGVNVYKQFRAIGKAADRFGLSLGRMRRQIGVLGRAFERGGLQEGFDQLFGKVGRNLLAEFGDAMGALPRTVGTALRQIRTGVDPLDRLFLNLGSALQQFGRFVENVFAGDFDRALTNLDNIGKRLKASAIDIGGIVVRVVSWAVQEGVSLATAVSDFVTTDLWPRIKTTATDIAGAAVNIASWAVSATGDLIGDVATFITGTAWPAVRDTATDIADVAISIGSWSVRAAAGIWDAVSDVVGAAWNLVKDVAIAIPDALLAVANFTVSLGDSVWGAVGGAVLTAWDLVKDTAIGIKDVALSVTNWLTDQIEAGTLVDSVTTFVEDTLATLNVTIDDWTLTVGAPGDDQITIDVGAIWDKIWNDIINPEFTPEQIQDAENAGAKIGQMAVDLIVGGIKAVFDLFGTGQGAGGGEEKLTGKDLVAGFLRGLFAGAFAEGLGIGADLATEARTWASNTLTAIRQAITDVFTGRTGLNTRTAGTGIVTVQEGIFDSIRDLFTTNPLDGVEFPDLVTPVTTWLSNQIAALKTAVSNAIPEWLKKLAQGDIIGVAKELFGGGGTGKQEIPIDVLPTGPNIGGGASHEGGFRAEPFIAQGRPIGAAIGDGVLQGIAEKQDDVATALRNLVTPPSGGAATAGGALTDFAKTAPPAIEIPAPDASKLLTGLADATKQTTRAMGAIVDAVAAIIAPISAAGQQASQSFAAGIALGMRTAIQAAASGAASVVSAARANLGTLGPAGFGVGQSLGYGIANGIASTIGAVASSAVALVSAAIKAARAFAEIASPSRLARRLVGLPLGLGVGAGFGDAIPTVKRNVADFIGDILPTTSASRMMGSQPTGHSGGTMIIYQNSYAAVTTDQLQEMLTKMERGHQAQTNWENVPRAYSLVVGGR